MPHGHLILSRKESERVILTLEDGREIEVVVCQINRKNVRLGFACDMGIGITRAPAIERVAAGEESVQS